MKVKLSELSVHPDNERIYSPTDLEDLERSLDLHGQKEPIAITKQKRIISGHRRFGAMRNLGWDECDARVVKPQNEIIDLIEFNRTRQKTVSDILNEVSWLEKELKDTVGRGRNARNERRGGQGKKMTMVMELSQRLGVGTTKLKKLMSIANYEPDLIPLIDSGDMSIAVAYERVRTKHIKKKHTKTEEQELTESLRRTIRKLNPSDEQLENVLKETYPYCLKRTGITEQHRADLIEHLDELKKLDSREILLVQKKDELDSTKITDEEFNYAKSLIPTASELEEWLFKTRIDKDDINEDLRFKVQTTENPNWKEFSTRNWNVLATAIHNMPRTPSIGRSLKGFVYFDSDDGKKIKILGLISLCSDVASLGARDDFIGWTPQQRAMNREHIANMNYCVPVQPFGFNMLGGKLCAIASKYLLQEWKKKYKKELLGITTTALHGSFSQYSGLKYWKSVGSSSGAMMLKPLSTQWEFWLDWYKENYSHLYNANPDRKDSPTTSPLQVQLNNIYKILDIDGKDYTHRNRRGVYFRPTDNNWKEILTKGKGKSESPIVHIGLTRDEESRWFEQAKKRFLKLKSEKKLLKKSLFHKKITQRELDYWMGYKI